jgi:uncharacterized protein
MHVSNREILVGIISDTHGLLRPEAVGALARSDLIIHAGDIGSPEIIEQLRDVAPTFAVRGNNDTGVWAEHLPSTVRVEVGQTAFWALHIISELDIDPAEAGYGAVVFGHSHKPLIEVRGGVTYINPGSAGPRRFRLPVTIALARISGRHISPEIIDLTL